MFFKIFRILTPVSGDLVSHSQMTMTLHPDFSSSALFRLSLSTFRSNFSCQNSILDLGVDAFLQSGCLCQKQPCTNMIVLYFGKTKSGLPGRLARWRRKRMPMACANLRTTISGLVSLPCTRAIRAERLSGVNLSIVHSAAMPSASLGEPSQASTTRRRILVATGGETLFPIILKLCQIVG